jgi:hypothetical protein
MSDISQNQKNAIIMLLRDSPPFPKTTERIPLHIIINFIKFVDKLREIDPETGYVAIVGGAATNLLLAQRLLNFLFEGELSKEEVEKVVKELISLIGDIDMKVTLSEGCHAFLMSLQKKEKFLHNFFPRPIGPLFIFHYQGGGEKPFDLVLQVRSTGVHLELPMTGVILPISLKDVKFLEFLRDFEHLTSEQFQCFCDLLYELEFEVPKCLDGFYVFTDEELDDYFNSVFKGHRKHFKQLFDETEPKYWTLYASLFGDPSRASRLPKLLKKNLYYRSLFPKRDAFIAHFLPDPEVYKREVNKVMSFLVSKFSALLPKCSYEEHLEKSKEAFIGRLEKLLTFLQTIPADDLAGPIAQKKFGEISKLLSAMNEGVVATSTASSNEVQKDKFVSFLSFKIGRCLLQLPDLESTNVLDLSRLEYYPFSEQLSPLVTYHVGEMFNRNSILRNFKWKLFGKGDDSKEDDSKKDIIHCFQPENTADFYDFYRRVQVIIDLFIEQLPSDKREIIRIRLDEIRISY